MTNFKFYYLFAFVAVALFITGCDKDDDNNTPANQITITIEEPMNGETIATANCSEVHVHVDFEATDENHEVEVVLHPEGDVNNKIIDYDKHDHDKKITFEQEVDLCSFPAGTCFHLEVKACVDHDCNESVTKDVEFCLQQ